VINISSIAAVDRDGSQRRLLRIESGTRFDDQSLWPRALAPEIRWFRFRPAWWTPTS